MDRGHEANMAGAESATRATVNGNPSGSGAMHDSGSRPLLVAIGVSSNEPGVAARAWQLLRQVWQEVPRNMLEPILAYWRIIDTVPRVEFLDDWENKGDAAYAVDEQCLLLRISTCVRQAPNEILAGVLAYWLARTYMHVEGDRQTTWRALSEKRPWPMDPAEQERLRREYAFSQTRRLPCVNTDDDGCRHDHSHEAAAPARVVPSAWNAARRAAAMRAADDRSESWAGSDAAGSSGRGRRTRGLACEESVEAVSEPR